MDPRIQPTRIETGQGSVPADEFEWRLPSGEDLISFALAIGFSAAPAPDSEAVQQPAGRRGAAVPPRRGQEKR